MKAYGLFDNVKLPRSHELDRQRKHEIRRLKEIENSELR